MELWIGRAGTGKTTAILQRIKQRASSGKKQILIVPELASHEYERLLAQATDNKGSRFAEVLTFRRIANRVFSEAGGLADTVLTPAGRLLVLYRAVQRSADGLSIYRDAVRKPDILRDMLQVLDELKCAQVSAEDLLKAAQEEGHLSAKLRDLGQIDLMYDTLTTEELPDPRDQLTFVAQRLPQSSLFDNTEVYFDRFDSFSKQELDIFAYLFSKHVPVVAALTGDSRFPEDFPEAETAAARLTAAAARCGEPVQRILFQEYQMPRPSDLSVLELYGLHPSDYQFDSDKHSVQLHAAGDVFSECEYAAAYIRKLLRETDAKRRDIVVTARNFEQYAPILELVCQRYEIPIFLSEKHDILQKPVLALVHAALHTVTGGWRYEDMFAYLKTGFAGLTAEECDELENYVLFRHIRGTQWIKPFTKSPERFAGVMDDAEKEQLEHLNTLREQAVQPLLALKAGLEQAQTAAQYVQVLYDFLEIIHAPECIAQRAQLHEEAGRLQTAEEYRQLWEILIQAMEQFAWVQGDTEMDTDAFVTLWGLVLTEYDVGTIPVALDRVTCGSIDRVCHTGIPHLIVLGMNDGVIPAAGDTGGILSESDREQLLGLEIELETGEDRMAREQAAIYRVFASASKTLLLSWNTVSGDGEARPSYLIGVVRQLLQDVPETSEADMQQSYRLEAQRPRFDLACRGAAGDYSAAARAALEASERPIEPMLAWQRGPLMEQQSVHGLYGKKLRLSASRVDTFYRCPYSYFLQYGLKAKQRRRAAFDAPETGTFLHDILEHTLQELKQNGMLEQKPDADTVKAIARKWIDEYVRENLGSLEEQTARFRHLFRKLTQLLDEILESLLEELAHSDFEPLDFELGFAYHAQLPPIEIDVKTSKLELNGKVDRVDGYVKDGVLYIRVMDYKSGYRKFELSDLWYGLNVQLLLYLFAIEETGLAYYRKKLAQEIDTIVPAGALYIPAKSSMISASRSTDDETLQKLRRKELRRSGLILNEQQIIEAMEHDGGFLPLDFKKDGQPTAASLSSLASMEQMGKLSKHVHQVLQRMGESLLDGQLQASPIRRGPMDTACTWCPYGAVCRFDTKMGDKPHNIGKIKTEKFWEELENEQKGT